MKGNRKAGLALVMALVFAVGGGFSVSAAALKAPSVKSATASSATAVTVRWKKVSGASGYAVYQKAGNGKFKKVAKRKGAKKVRYTKNGLKPATKYTYKIRAYKGSTYSGDSQTRTVYTKPATPKITSARATSNTAVELRWNRVARATGYVVYKTIGKRSKAVATIQSGKTTTYRVKALKQNTRYSFAVAAYYKPAGKRIYSAKSGLVSILTPHVHRFNPYRCAVCGALDKGRALDDLKAWILSNGKVNGSYVSVVYTTDDGTYYAVNYDANTGDLYVNTISADAAVYGALYLNDARYFVSVHESLDMIGQLDAGRFTDNTPITYTYYNGTSEDKLYMTELSRLTACELLAYLDWFFQAYDVGMSLSDFGFTAF